MIVGRSDVSILEVERHSKDVKTFIQFADSLIPQEFRNVLAIQQNQRYLCCLILRKSKSISWDKKEALITEVLAQVRITGFVDNIISAEDIWTFVDKEKLNKHIRRLDESNSNSFRGK